MSDTWKALAPLRSARSVHTVNDIGNDKFIVIGGGSNNSANHYRNSSVELIE